MIYQSIDSTLVMFYFKFGENLACFTRYRILNSDQ